MGDDTQNPADGPNGIEECQVGDQREDGIDPNKPQGAHKDQRGNGGNGGLSDASEDAGQHFVDAADEIGAGNDDHLLSGESDHFRAVRHQRRQLAGETGGQRAQRCAKGDGDQRAAPDRGFHALQVACAHILGNKRHNRQRRGVNDLVKDTVKLVGDGYAGGGRFAETVDGRGDHRIGKGVKGRLHTGGNADAEHSLEFFEIEYQLTEIDLNNALEFDQPARKQEVLQQLANNRCGGNAFHAHAQNTGRKNRQRDLGQAANHGVIERPLGVAGGSQNRRGKTMEHNGRHAQKIESEIGGGLREQGFRAVDPLQKCLGKGHTDDHHNQAAHNGEQQRGHCGPVCLLLVAGADTLCHGNICADGSAGKQTGAK